MSTFEVVAPEKIRFSMTLSYELEDWLRIAAQLKAAGEHVPYPASLLCSDILDMSLQAKKTFYPK